jgi:hypothetical protein
VVRDFPENLAAIEAALARPDQPMAARRDLGMHIHVLFASLQEGPSTGFPEERKGTEKVVVGTSALKDRGLIGVVTAKVLK